MDAEDTAQALWDFLKRHHNDIPSPERTELWKAYGILYGLVEID